MGLGTSSAGVAAFRSSLRQIAAHSYYATEPSGARTLASIVVETPIFARRGVGELLAPVTDAAADMLSGTQGRRLRRILDAAAHTADARPNSPFRGIVLADDADALAGWKRIRSIEANTAAMGVDIADAPPIAPYDDLAVSRQQFDDAAAHYDDGFIVALEGRNAGIDHLLRNDGVARSNALATAIHDGASNERVFALAMPDEVLKADGAQTLLHEIEHADGVQYSDDVARAIEEGGDQVITMWPGRLERFVDDMGLGAEIPQRQIDRLRPMNMYPEEHSGVAGLVAMAGIDYTDAARLDEGIALLRHRRPTSEVLDDLAARITRHAKVDSGREPAVREALGAGPASLERNIAVAKALLGTAG